MTAFSELCSALSTSVALKQMRGTMKLNLELLVLPVTHVAPSSSKPVPESCAPGAWGKDALGGN